MRQILAKIDTLAETDCSVGVAKFFRRAAFVFVLLMAAAAPHSIAATQTAWLLGMLCWICSLVIGGQDELKFGLPGRLLAAYFIWSAVSSALSYEPIVSLDKLRGASVFLIFPFVVNVIRNRKAVILAAGILIFSGLVGALYAPLQKIIGRGIEVHGLESGGLLASKGVSEGDTLLAANGVKTTRPEDVIARIEVDGSARIDVYRTDAPFTIEIRRDELPQSTEAANSRLGFEAYRRSSNFRVSGFYGHYTTFAEAVQLIASLCFGLLIAAVRGRAGRSIIALLCTATLTFILALLLTVTRGSQAAFVISAFSITALGGGRRILLIVVALAAIASAVGLFILHNQRGVGFADFQDGSVKYRQMMWRDGSRLLIQSPRNLVYGVGMDSIKTHWEEWGLFDKGWQPMGHFHSTPLQIAVERGLPALLLWFAVLVVYARSLLRGIRRVRNAEWVTLGILLGCFGGLVGFVAGGFVHYNLGDTEVAMIFYFLMGISIRLSDIVLDESSSRGHSAEIHKNLTPQEI